jgi:hypothetical protein
MVDFTSCREVSVTRFPHGPIHLMFRSGILLPTDRLVSPCSSLSDFSRSLRNLRRGVPTRYLSGPLILELPRWLLVKISPLDPTNNLAFYPSENPSAK